MNPSGGTELSGAVPPRAKARALRQLAAAFLKLGLIGFGGPAAHVGLMEEELVRRRGWLSREEFLDLFAVANLIPGPNSTELALLVGRRQAGAAGLLVAGLCFILPAVLLVMAGAWAYVRYGAWPAVTGVLAGVKPVILAVVVQALWGLGRTAVKGRFHAVLAASAVGLGFLGVDELCLLAGIGLCAAVAARPGPAAGRLGAVAGAGLSWGWPASGGGVWLAAAAVGGGAAAAAAPFSLTALFLFFLKVGALLYGSGYVLLAFVRADLVERWHWLTESQLLDAIALGQVTPGPLFSSATFMGYLLGGVPAALAATVGIFLPAFVLVAVSGPLLERVRRSAMARAFLDGVVIASLGLMVVVTWALGRAALGSLPAVALGAASAWGLFQYRINSAWLVLAGGALGWLGAQLSRGWLMSL